MDSRRIHNYSIDTWSSKLFHYYNVSSAALCFVVGSRSRTLWTGGIMQLMLQHCLFFFSFPPFDIIYHLSIWEENNMTTTTKCSKHKRPWDFVSNLIKQRIHKKIWCVWQNIHSGYKKWWHAKLWKRNDRQALETRHEEISHFCQIMLVLWDRSGVKEFYTFHTRKKIRWKHELSNDKCLSILSQKPM